MSVVGSLSHNQPIIFGANGSYYPQSIAGGGYPYPQFTVNSRGVITSVGASPPIFTTYDTRTHASGERAGERADSPPFIIKHWDPCDNPFTDFKIVCTDGEILHSRYALYHIPYFRSLFDMSQRCNAQCPAVVESSYSKKIVRVVLGIDNANCILGGEHVDVAIAADYYGVDATVDHEAVVRHAKGDKGALSRAWNSGIEEFRKHIVANSSVRDMIAIGCSLRDIVHYDKGGHDIGKIIRLYAEAHGEQAASEIDACIADNCGDLMDRSCGGLKALLGTLSSDNDRCGRILLKIFGYA